MYFRFRLFIMIVSFLLRDPLTNFPSLLVQEKLMTRWGRTSGPCAIFWVFAALPHWVIVVAFILVPTNKAADLQSCLHSQGPALYDLFLHDSRLLGTYSLLSFQIPFHFTQSSITCDFPVRAGHREQRHCVRPIHGNTSP